MAKVRSAQSRPERPPLLQPEGTFAGVNNVFDEDFWAEIRGEGIVPAYGRNYYGDVSIKF